jgi:Fe-S cluster assembly protein SufD
MTFITKDSTLIEVFSDTQETKTINVSDSVHFQYLAILKENAKIDLNIYGSGSWSKITLKVLCIGNAHHHIQSNILVSLDANQTQADVYILSLMKEGSDIHIHGNITISPNIIKTTGHLLEETLILWEHIKIRTAPILDVRSNDVSASHGCRIERLDPKRLFYMQSRGLNHSESQSLILDGYINSLFEWFEENEEIMKDVKALLHEDY